MASPQLRAIYKQLSDKIDKARDEALLEVKELKADLNELQRHLSGRKKQTDIQPDDILRSAYEISHYLREMDKRKEVLAEMQDVADEIEALEYLESRGAKLLARPAGWHFQSTKERFLLHQDDPVQAAAKLRKLLAAGKRRKRTTKKKANNFRIRQTPQQIFSITDQPVNRVRLQVDDSAKKDAGGLTLPTGVAP